MKRELNAISLYTGIGGLDFGFEAAGFNTRVAVELDRHCATLLQQMRSWPLICDDICQVSSDDILKTAQLSRGEADVLIGGPPCQPFSKSSYWSTGDSPRLADARAQTIREYLRVLRDTLPRTFLIENVEGLGFRNKEEGLNLILATIAAINSDCDVHYSASYAVLNAVDYGVPQSRRRLFIIGSRDGRSFRFPLPTHASPDELVHHGIEPYRTAWDALWNVRAQAPGLEARGKWADLLPSIPPGNNYLWHTERGGGLPLFGWRRRYWNFLLKLSPERPSWTLQAQPGPATGPFHWDNRRLAAQELARLQTFPADIELTDKASAQRMMGNAVPSLMAEVLAKEMKRQFLDDFENSPLQLRVDASPLPPPKYRAMAVPEKYRSLAGEHPAHPGTGKGARAHERAAIGFWRGSLTLENVGRQ